MKTQLSKSCRQKLWRKSGRSAAKVAAELGIRAPLLYVGHGPSAKLTTAKLSSTLDEVLKNWKRRSVVYAQRTLNFWSSGKF